MDKIKLGCAPINWSNDDMPELGAEISFEQCIDEMNQAGYVGCEVGHKFTRDPNALKKALEPKGLSVASAWFSSLFTEESVPQATIDRFIPHMLFLKAMGAKVIVVAECGYGIQQKEEPICHASPRFNAVQWQNLCQGLESLGNLAQKQGMSVVYHPHMGTGIEKEEDIDYLMAHTSETLVSLLLDTGHTYFAGGHNLNLIQKHGHRIKHVHLKDIRQDILQEVKEENLSFLAAVKRGVFTVPGDGCIDFQPIFAALQELNYEGWWVVEAEQDPRQAHPLTYAKKARQYVREMAGI